jgi:hypothetical protein
LKTKVLAAVLAVLVSGPVLAGERSDADWIGAHKPGFTLTFNAGTNADSEYNSGFGIMGGSHIALARLGPLRFPTVGAGVGILDYCPLDAPRSPAGPDGNCVATFAGQLTTGFDLVLDRARNHDGRVWQEIALTGGLTRVVVGRLSGNWGVQLGISYRWRGKDSPYDF